LVAAGPSQAQRDYGQAPTDKLSRVGSSLAKVIDTFGLGGTCDAYFPNEQKVGISSNVRLAPGVVAL
jgi:hypothetical protein